MYGNPLEVGDVIAYPVRWGSSMWMSTAVIRSITMKKQWWHKEDDPGMPIASTSVIVPDGWTRTVSTEGTTFHLRRSRFESFDRCIKVDAANLPGDMGRYVIRVLEELRSTT